MQDETKGLRIAIDPGKHTGFAIVKDGILVAVKTLTIHEAILRIHAYMKRPFNNLIEVIIEDARNIGGDKFRAQGAGSIKRDCTIWEDFLTEYKIPFRFIRAGKNITKKSDDYLYLQTGWTGVTSQHGRDAACMLLPYINHNTTTKQNELFQHD